MEICPFVPTCKETELRFLVQPHTPPPPAPEGFQLWAPRAAHLQAEDSHC